MASDLRSVEESQPYSFHPDNQQGVYPSPFSPFCPDSAPWKNGLPDCEMGHVNCILLQALRPDNGRPEMAAARHN